MQKKKFRLRSGGSPFQLQCGLPLGVERAESQKRGIKDSLSNGPCRGGIGDELLFRKAPGKKCRKK